MYLNISNFKKKYKKELDELSSDDFDKIKNIQILTLKQNSYLQKEFERSLLCFFLLLR
jgi:hypothetical protein